MASVSKRSWTHQGEQKTAWVVRHVDRAGVHRQRTFAKKKDADLFRSQIETEKVGRSLGTYVDRKTIAAVAREFLLAEEARVRDGRLTRGGLKNIRMALDLSIEPRIGAQRLDELKAADVEDLYADLVRDGLAPSTARCRMQVLHRLAVFGERRGYARGNVVLEALKSLRGVSAAPIDTFVPQDIVQLLRTADTQGFGQHRRSWLMTRCIVSLAAFCGLRQGEILGLTVAHLDLAGRAIAVRQSLSPTDGLKAPKTQAGFRDVPMPQHVADMIADWLEDGYTPNPRQLLFIAGMGGRSSGVPLSGASFRSGHWLPLLARAGFTAATSAQEAGRARGKHIHFHALRHFAASWMIANQMPLPDVAALLGHKRFDLTLQVYAHPIVTGARRVEAFDQMASKLLAAPAADRAPLVETAQGNLRMGYARTAKHLKRQAATNIVTIRAEERLALAVYRPEAFVKGDFSDALAA
jgi:integrase